MQFIYIKIPKTAGQSVQAALKNYLPSENSILSGHKTIDMILPELTSEQILQTIATIKEPYSRMVSVYWWSRKKREWPGDLEFKDWVIKYQNITNTDLYDKGYWFKPQLDWITAKDGFIVKNILRVENLQNDLNHLCDIYDINHIPLPHLNANPIKPQNKQWQDYYDSESQRIVYDVYKKDFDYFGYNPNID